MAMDRIEFARIRKHWHSILSPTIRKYGWKAPFFNVFFADKTLFSDGEHAFSFVDLENRRAVTINNSTNFSAYLEIFDEEENPINVLYLSCPTTQTLSSLFLIKEWLIKKIAVQNMKSLLEMDFEC